MDRSVQKLAHQRGMMKRPLLQNSVLVAEDPVALVPVGVRLVSDFEPRSAAGHAGWAEPAEL